MEVTLGKFKYTVSLPKRHLKSDFTTNAIESLNSVIRKPAKNRKRFPNDGLLTIA
jgi:transposase-like protein